MDSEQISETRVSKIPIAKPILGTEEKEAVSRIIDSGMLAQGSEVKHFEEEFAAFIGSKHAIATSSGTSALHAALLSHGIGKGDEVITTPFTFIATANSILMTGATPIFCDIDPVTFNINPDQIESKITKNTKAILPVHLYGKAADMKKIEEIAIKHNLIIIEDACQSHGATYENKNHETKKVGSENTACFSFYPTKNMTTSEGGIITTNNDEIAEKTRRAISHGQTQRYHHSELGFNLRMTNIAAAIGRVQLRKLPTFNQKRKNNAKFFSENIRSSKIIVPEITEGHVFHQYCLRVKDNLRDSLKEFLSEKGIGSEVYYPIPIHKQKSFERYNLQFFPEAEKAAKEVLAIPVHPSLTEEETKRIVDCINLFDNTTYEN